MAAKRRYREDREQEDKGADKLVGVGGQTDYGRLLDAVAQRYGWSYEEIMWGISYVSVNMMILDAMDVVKAKNKYLDATDPRNIEIFKQITGLN